MMSMSVGPFCGLNQDVDSKDAKTGAVVALKMDENERECKYILIILLHKQMQHYYGEIWKTLVMV